MTDIRMGYGGALRVVLDLAGQNQIDEHDIARGDEGLEDQRKLQDAALETVQAYIDRGGPDALPEPTEPLDASEAGLAQTDDPDPGHLPDALRIVLDMGRNNILDDDGPDMADEVARQECAVALVEDALNRHAEALAAPAGPSGP